MMAEAGEWGAIKGWEVAEGEEKVLFKSKGSVGGIMPIVRIWLKGGRGRFVLKISVRQNE